MTVGQVALHVEEKQFKFNFIRDQELPPHRPNLAGDLIVWLVAILVSWALGVMNIELLIHWNHFTPSDSAKSIWGFGQVCSRINYTIISHGHEQGIARVARYHPLSGYD